MLLAARRLIIPIVGISHAGLRDTFDERRGTGKHEAIDIAAPRGTPVFAVDDGRGTRVRVLQRLGDLQQLAHRDPSDYLIRVNRQPAAADQVLQDQDRVSFTATKIEGAY